MVDNRIIDLINRKIDGLLVPEEEARLNRIIAGDPEVRRLFQELSQTSQTLNKVVPVEPDENLKKRILNALEAKRPVAKKMSYPEKLKLYLFPEKQAKRIYALALAFGSAAAVLFTAFVPKFAPLVSYDQYRGLSGTIGLPGIPPAIVMDKTDIDLADATGDISLARAGHDWILEFDIDTEGSYILSLLFENDYLSYRGLSIALNDGLQITSTGRSVRLSGNGESRYLLFFTSHFPSDVEAADRGKSNEPTTLNLFVETKKGSLNYSFEIIKKI